MLMQNFGGQMRCIMEDLQVAYEQKLDYQKELQPKLAIKGNG